MTPSSADTIRTRMKQIRCELGNDMDEIVESTREMTDWKSYVKGYPWLCVGVAAAVGYIVVPKRVEIVTPDAKTLLKLAKHNQLVVNTDPHPHAKSGLTGMAVNLLVNAALRGAVAFVGQQFGKVATEQTMDANTE